MGMGMSNALVHTTRSREVGLYSMTSNVPTKAMTKRTSSIIGLSDSCPSAYWSWWSARSQ